jgi:hypothetical protein
MSSEHRLALGKFMMAMVVADGMVRAAEVTAARLLFVRLGLDPSEVDRTLKSTTTATPATPATPATADDLVRVMDAHPGKLGETIPPPPVAGLPMLSINREAVARIMLETREVAKLLADAMAVETDEETSTLPPPPPAHAARNEGPPARYATFFAAIVKQSIWPATEVDTLARQHNLMASGAVEAINEWAFERWNTNLIYDDGESFHVEINLIENT